MSNLQYAEATIMNHYQEIEKLKGIFPKIEGINAAILYGSCARGDANPNSDIDIKLIVNQNFQLHVLEKELKALFHTNILQILKIKLRDKIVVYLRDKPKIELAICHEIKNAVRDIQGSRIPDLKQCILFQNQNYHVDIEAEIAQLIIPLSDNSDWKTKVDDLVNKFLYEFENCSTMHRRSDGYRSYFFYNIALHAAIQIYQLSKNEDRFSYLPKNFISNILDKKSQNAFYELRSTLYLPEVNKAKENLLNFFYSGIEVLLDHDRVKEIKEFCDHIYQRDFFWNFRDISTNNSKLKPDRIFRSATLSLFHSNSLEELVSKHKIKTIIDLRADREIKEHPYTNIPNQINYLKAQFDPWDQPEWFKEKYNYGTNEEIAYRFFVIGCREQIKKIVESMLNATDGAVLIHCFAGKDRTGIIITLLHLITDAPYEVIYADYMASESDVQQYRLDMVLELIDSYGGAEQYLLQCGLSSTQITALKTKLAEK